MIYDMKNNVGRLHIDGFFFLGTKFFSFSPTLNYITPKKIDTVHMYIIDDSQSKFRKISKEFRSKYSTSNT